MDATEKRARRLLDAATSIRCATSADDAFAEPTFYEGEFYDAVAAMLEVEGNLRLTQPRGFYEVEAADLIADTILGQSRES